MTVISSNVGKNPLEEMEQSPQSIKDSKMKNKQTNKQTKTPKCSTWCNFKNDRMI